jgi:acetyltransferase
MQPLDALFKPRHVALIGASEREGSVGRALMTNLVGNPFGGTVYPVTPAHESVFGLRAYRSVTDVLAPVDLAIIATPARTVPEIVRECVASGVRGAIIISAGFKEIGAEGVKLEQEVLAEAQKGPMRLIGPNCLGVMVPTTGMNATFASATARPGGVAFLSQSGALLTSILDWSLLEHVGFSAFHHRHQVRA